MTTHERSIRGSASRASARALERAQRRFALAKLPFHVVPHRVGALGEELGRSLRSQIHLVRGATSAAALSWETFRVETASSKIALSPFFALTRERFLRALNLREVGRNEEALKWFSTFGEVSVYDLAYLAPARFHRGQMLEGLRDLDSAALEYRQVLELWAHADPELLPLVEQARARLRAMGLAAD